jgi:nitroreductase/NAD-dependent dihydropyrimidine dehydrogenase PreA subunit
MLFHVDPEKCNGDKICVEACGRRLIEFKEPESLPTPIAGAEELCNGCGHCVAVCPTGALARNDMSPEDCAQIINDLAINPTQAEQFLRSRRSTRKFKDRPVEREKLNKLVQIMGYAPSAHNARPVHLLVIANTKEIKRLASLILDFLKLMIKQAPALAASNNFPRVVQLLEKEDDPLFGNAPHLIIAHAPESSLMAQIDCALALGYAELAAHSLGLGMTWSGFGMAAAAFSPPFKEALGLPEKHKCFGVMMVGYPKVQFSRMPARKTPPVTWR